MAERMLGVHLLNCEICPERFSNIDDLHHHIQNEHILCAICCKVFSTAQELERHYYSQHSSTSSQGKVGDLQHGQLPIEQGIQQSGNDSLDIQFHSLPQITCQGKSSDAHCTSQQPSQSKVSIDSLYVQLPGLLSMQQHDNVNLDTTFLSEQISKSGHSTDNLKATNYRKNPSKSKGKKGKLKPDVKSEEKLWKCSICEKRFARKVGLSQHFRVHRLAHNSKDEGGTVREKPFQCPVCKKLYQLEHNLKRHMQIQKHFTKEMPYECYISKERFRNHMETSHNFIDGIKEMHTAVIRPSAYDDNNESETSTVGANVTVSRNNETETNFSTPQTSASISQNESSETDPTYDTNRLFISDHESETDENKLSESESSELTSGSTVKIIDISGADNKSKSSEIFYFSDQSVVEGHLSLQCPYCAGTFTSYEHAFIHDLQCSSNASYV